MLSILISLNISSRSISGYCIVKVVSKTDKLAKINLDLLGLTVDSTLANGAIASHNYNDTLLTVNLPQALNTGDSSTLAIYYHGKPVNEKWGGFYFTDYFAYNMGVGFIADPSQFWPRLVSLRLIISLIKRCMIYTSPLQPLTGLCVMAC